MAVDGLLRDLARGPQERRLVERYLKAPGGRSFLAVAKLLATRGHVAEALGLLHHGCQCYPEYFQAHVYLAHVLYREGWLGQALAVLGRFPFEVLTTSSLAVETVVRCAIVEHDCIQLRRLLEIGTRCFPGHRFFGEAAELLRGGGISTLHAHVLDQDFTARGVEPQPSRATASPQAATPLQPPPRLPWGKMPLQRVAAGEIFSGSLTSEDTRKKRRLRRLLTALESHLVCDETGHRPR